MPNVIAIIHDPKARSQIENYLKEIDEDNTRVRFFNSSYEFEQKYFAAKKATPAHPLSKIKGLESFSNDQLEAALNSPLAEKSPLPIAKIKLKVNRKTGKVEGTEPALDSNQILFDLHIEDVLKSGDFLGQLVLPEFRDLWLKHLSGLSGEESETFLPFRAKSPLSAWMIVKSQILTDEQWLIELSDDSERLKDTFNKEIERRKVHEEESDELQLLSEIDVILFSLDCIHGKTLPWIDHLWHRLREGGYFPKENQTRMVLLKYEDDGVQKVDVIHPHLDDLIYLPLDRLIFLQKMEIIYGLPKAVTPSFLFTQEVSQTIELSKITKVERLSDVGLAIRNPVRLVSGLLAHFHLTFPSETEPIDFWGKVIRSEVHPERPKEYLVYFSFFGLTRHSSQVIKKYLAKVGKYQPFLNGERNDFAYNPDNIFVADQDRKIKQIVVLEIDETLAHQLHGTLPKEFPLVKCVAETSFALFSAHHLAGAQGNRRLAERAVNESDLFAAPLEILVNRETLDLNTTITIPSTVEHKYFGHSAQDSLVGARNWLKPFLALPENEGLMKEMARLASEGKKISRLLTIVNESQNALLLRISMAIGAAPETVHVTLSLPSADDLRAKQAQHEKIESIDLVILDFALVPSGNIDGFMEAFCSQAEAAGLIKGGIRPKFLITVENEKQIDHHRFTHKDIVGILPKPVENRPLNFLVTVALDLKFTVYRFENLSWTPTILPIHVAKEVQLEELSEFGGALRHPRPIAAGSILFLRSWIFDHAPNKCLAARIYFCEEHPSEAGQYQCSFIYFGINDGFMKYARKWFMETHALAKQSEGA